MCKGTGNKGKGENILYEQIILKGRRDCVRRWSSCW